MESAGFVGFFEAPKPLKGEHVDSYRIARKEAQPKPTFWGPKQNKYYWGRGYAQTMIIEYSNINTSFYDPWWIGKNKHSKHELAKTDSKKR